MDPFVHDEYFLSSILFHRQVYSQVDFNALHNPQYGNSLSVLADIQVVDYLNRVLEQVLRASFLSFLFVFIPLGVQISVGWLPTRSITHLVLVFLSKSTGKTLERWTFDLHPSSPNSPSTPANNDSAPASIQNLLKQIPSAASFLPDLQEPVVFNILVYKRDESLSPSSSKEKAGKVKTQSKAQPLEAGWRDVTEDAGTMAFEADTEVQNVSYATTQSG